MSDAFILQGTITADNKQAIQGMKEVERQGEQTDKKVSGSFSSLAKSVGSAMSTVGTVMMGVSTAVGTGAITMYSSFETVVQKVSTLASDQIMPTLSADMKKLSTVLGKDATDVGEAMYEGLSAGVSEKNITDFTLKMGKLAKGGFTEVSTATDIATTVVNAYGLEIEEVTKISDILIQTQNKGKTTVNDLATNMGKVIPTAKAMNVQFDELGTAYAIATSKGIATAEATTYLNSLLNELNSTTGMGAYINKEMGTSYAELNAQGYNLGQIISMMNDHMKANGTDMNATKSSAEAYKMALTLLSDEGREFTEMQKLMNNSAGATDEAFRKMDETFKAKVDKSIQKVKSGFISLGENMVPLLETKILPLVEKFADWMANLDTKTIENITSWVSWGVALGGALTVGGKMLTFGVNAVDNFNKLSGTVKTLTASGTTMGNMLGKLGGLFSPTGLLIGGVVALTGAFIKNQSECRKSADEFKAMGNEVDDFSGRLKTNDSIWTSIFGKKYEFKFSEDFKQAKEQYMTEAEELNTKAEEYNISLNEILASDVPEEEKATKLQEYFERQREELEIGMMKQKEMDASDQATRRANYEMFLKDLGYLTNVEIQERLASYDSGYMEIQNSINNNENAILEIKKLAIDNGRTLTQEEMNEIARLNAENGKLRGQIAMETGADINEAEQLAHLRTKEILGESVADHEKADVDKLTSLTSYVDKANAEYDKIRANIEDDITLSKRQKNQKIADLNEQYSSVKAFENNFASSLQNNMARGDNWATAFATATKNFSRAMQTSGYSAEDTLNALNEHFRNSGLEGEDLSTAINHAFSSIADDVLANSRNAESEMKALGDAFTNAGGDVGLLETKIKRIPKDTKVKAEAKVEGENKANNLRNAIDRLYSKTVNVHTNYTSSGQRPNGYAKGSEGIIPKRAYGDEAFKNTQTALVGEQGPEVVELPRGAKVKTHRETRNSLGNENKQPILVAVQVDGRTIAYALAEHLGEAIRNNQRQTGFGGAW